MLTTREIKKKKRNSYLISREQYRKITSEFFFDYPH